TAHSLAEPSDNVFRFVPDDLREGEAVVALLRHDGIDAIVPVWRRDAGNAGLASSVRGKFVAAGGKVSKGVPYATKATSFSSVGYPNPTVGLSDSLVRRGAPLLARARKRLGRDPDALALTAYDALRIAVEARLRAGVGGGATLRRALVAAANAHVGVTGRMTLNRAGDR